MQTYSQTFAGPSTWELNVVGSYYATLTCTNNVNVRFYLGGKLLDLGEIKGLKAGLEVNLPKGESGIAFDRVQIDATGADTITVGIGNGQARYSRGVTDATITNTVAVSVQNTPTVNAVITQAVNPDVPFTQAAASVTTASGQLRAAKAARQFLMIQNNDAALPIFVTLDGTAATTAKGLKVSPGGTLTLDSVCPTGAINAITASGTNSAIVVVEG